MQRNEHIKKVNRRVCRIIKTPEHPISSYIDISENRSAILVFSSKMILSILLCCPVSIVSSCDVEASQFGLVSEPISMWNKTPALSLTGSLSAQSVQKQKRYLSLFFSFFQCQLQQAKAAGECPDSRSEWWRRIRSTCCLVFTSHMKSSESLPSSLVIIFSLFISEV